MRDQAAGSSPEAERWAHDDLRGLFDEADAKLMIELSRLSRCEDWPEMGLAAMRPFAVYLDEDEIGESLRGRRIIRRPFRLDAPFERVLGKLAEHDPGQRARAWIYTWPYGETEDGHLQVLSIAFHRGLVMPKVRFVSVIPAPDEPIVHRVQLIPDAMLQLIFEPRWAEASGL